MRTWTDQIARMSNRPAPQSLAKNHVQNSAIRIQRLAGSRERTRQEIIAFVQQHPGCSAGDITPAMCITRSYVNRCLLYLTDTGRLRSKKKGRKKRYWAVV